MDIECHSRMLQHARQRAEQTGMIRVIPHLDRIQSRLDAFKEASERCWPVKMTWTMQDIEKARSSLEKEEGSGIHAMVQERAPQKGSALRSLAVASCALIAAGPAMILIGGDASAGLGFAVIGTLGIHLYRALSERISADGSGRSASQDIEQALSGLQQDIERHLGRCADGKCRGPDAGTGNPPETDG